MSQDDEPEYIEYRFYLIGEPSVGKRSIINRLSNLPCTKTLPPLPPPPKSTFPSSPSKLFNINRFKLVFTSIYVPPLEPLSYDYEPKFLDDSDYEVEKTHKMSLRKLKSLLSSKLPDKTLCIPIHKLPSYRISIENLFIFVWDLSDYATFEKLPIYYDSLVKKYKINDSTIHNNCILIGNKTDKRVLLTYPQQHNLSAFITTHNLNYYEISTRPYFAFEKFFHVLFYDMYFKSREQFNTKTFEDTFNLVLMAKPSFSKSARIDLSKLGNDDSTPGPGAYNLNLYSYEGKKEIKDALNNKKTRFKRKIFANKSGPILVRNKYEELTAEKLQEEQQQRKLLFGQGQQQQKQQTTKKKLTNEFREGNAIGYTFGCVEGALNLKQLRREAKNAQREIVNASLNENTVSSILNNNTKTSIRDEEYFKAVLDRKFQYQQNILEDKRQRLLKLSDIHKRNLLLQEQLRKEKQLNIFDNQHIKNDTAYDDNTNNDNRRERYYMSLYPNNKKHLEKLSQKLSSNIFAKTITATPAPNAYDIRGNMLNPKKGFTIQGRSQVLPKQQSCPEFPTIKDDFEIIAANVNNNRRHYGERFKPLVKEPPEVNKKYAMKWEQWEKNKERSEKKENIELLIENRKLFKQEQEIALQKHRVKEEERIMNSRGYDPDADFREINYKQIEEASPSFTIKGRNYVNNNNNNSERHVLGNAVNYVGNEITGSAFALPKYDYVKPGAPKFSFDKAKRFNDVDDVNVDNDDEREKKYVLFENGKFALDDRTDFSTKERFNINDKRGWGVSDNGVPGPGDYKIKSFTDVIIEEGKKVSEYRTKMYNIINKNNHNNRPKEKIVNDED